MTAAAKITPPCYADYYAAAAAVVQHGNHHGSCGSQLMIDNNSAGHNYADNWSQANLQVPSSELEAYSQNQSYLLEQAFSSNNAAEPQVQYATTNDIHHLQTYNESHQHHPQLDYEHQQSKSVTYLPDEQPTSHYQRQQHFINHHHHNHTHQLQQQSSSGLAYQQQTSSSHMQASSSSDYGSLESQVSGVAGTLGNFPTLQHSYSNVVCHQYRSAPGASSSLFRSETAAAAATNLSASYRPNS